MRLIVNDEQLQTIEQVKQFLEGSEPLEFIGLSTEEKYKWIETALVKFKYNELKKAEKGVIRQYIQEVTGYSSAQVFRLIKRVPMDRAIEENRIKKTSDFPGRIPHQKLNYWPKQMNYTGG